MFEDLKQRGTGFAVGRSLFGLVGSAGFFAIVFLNIFGLDAAFIQRFRLPVVALCIFCAAASAINLKRAKNAGSGIEAYCAKTADPAATMARLEKTWNEGYDFGAGRIDPAYIILTNTVSPKVAPLENAAWVYKKTTRQGAAMHIHLFVCYSNAKYKSFALGSGTVDAIIDYIYKNCPEIAVGFDEKLDKFYAKKDAQSFKEYALAQRAGVKTEV